MRESYLTRMFRAFRDFIDEHIEEYERMLEYNFYDKKEENEIKRALKFCTLIQNFGTKVF